MIMVERFSMRAVGLNAHLFGLSPGAVEHLVHHSNESPLKRNDSRE